MEDIESKSKKAILKGGIIMAINTSGLSGYALAYANAANKGANSTQATQAANTSAYGNSAGPTTNAQKSQALSGSKYSVVPGTTGLIASSLIPSNNSSNRTSLIPTVPQSQPWQQALESFKNNPSAATAEIQRAGVVYNQKMVAGDIVGANAAHTWANQIRDASGLVAGKDYNSMSGASLAPLSLIPPTPVAPPPLVPDPILPPLAELPQFDYQQKPFEYTPPNYSITADPSKTSFIPTSHAKDRWVQQEQLNADNAYKGYTAGTGAWDRAYKAGQDTYANNVSLLPYEKLTVAQQADVAMSEAKAKTDATNLIWDQNYKDQQLALDKQNTDYATGKPYYDPNSGSGGSGSKPTQTDRNNTAMGEAMQMVTSAINSGSKHAEIAQSIKNNAASFIQAGVDYTKVLEYLDQAYDPNLAAYEAYINGKQTQPTAYDPNSFMSNLFK